MTSSSFEERKVLFLRLTEHYHVQCRHITHGACRGGGLGPPYAYEAYIEVCTILLYIGDVFGYIVLDDDCVVDPIRSNDTFLKGFVKCLELMHEWCIRHPPPGNVPSWSRWLTSGSHRNALVEHQSCLRNRMVNVSYPDVTGGSVMPEGALFFSSNEVRELFLQTSKSMFDFVEGGTQLNCPHYRFSEQLRSIGLYLKTGVLRVVDPHFLIGECPREQSQDILSLRLSWSVGGPYGVVDEDWKHYWTLQSCSSNGTLYDGIKELLL